MSKFLTLVDGVQTLQAAGGFVLLPVTTADCENTTNETTIIEFTVPANTWADGEWIEVDAVLSQRAGTSSSFQTKTFINTSVVVTSSLSSVSNVNGSTNYQRSTLFKTGANIVVWNGFGNIGAPATMIYVPASNDLMDGTQNGTSNTIDFSNDITIKYTKKFTVANVNSYVRPLSVSVKHFKKQ